MSPWFSQLNAKSQRNSSRKCNSSYLATQQRINSFHHKNIKKTSEIYHKTWPAINLVSPFITTTWQGSSSPTKVPHTLYRIAENFWGRKLSQIGEKYNFRTEDFHGFLTCATPKDTMPPNFTEKTFVNSHKTVKFAKIFSLESFPLYGSCVTIASTFHGTLRSCHFE